MKEKMNIAKKYWIEKQKHGFISLLKLKMKFHKFYSVIKNVFI